MKFHLKQVNILHHKTLQFNNPQYWSCHWTSIIISNTTLCQSLFEPSHEILHETHSITQCQYWVSQNNWPHIKMSPCHRTICPLKIVWFGLNIGTQHMDKSGKGPTEGKAAFVGELFTQGCDLSRNIRLFKSEHIGEYPGFLWRPKTTSWNIYYVRSIYSSVWMPNLGSNIKSHTIVKFIFGWLF